MSNYSSHFPPFETLSLDLFKEMDYFAVNHYGLSIELMMEYAGLQLAHLIAEKAHKSSFIRIGVGNGNNGGGGLVAARRLSGWGFTNVFIDPAVEITKELPKIQFERTIAFGAKLEIIENPDIWVDAYLGFSQRLPLGTEFTKRIEQANKSAAYRIALDLPVGISWEGSSISFQAHQVLTLAAPKDILNVLPAATEIQIGDIGIPKSIYIKYGLQMPSFYRGHGLLKK